MMPQVGKSGSLLLAFENGACIRKYGEALRQVTPAHMGRTDRKFSVKIQCKLLGVSRSSL